MDCEITELVFWDMTPGEVIRAIESYNRRVRLDTQEKASFDYIQATLIVKGFGIALSGKGVFPSIQETYPNIFNEVIEKQEKELQAKREELSALRFKQFAQSYNMNFKGGAKVDK